MFAVETLFAPVAQWIEHRSSKPVAVSSSLTGRAYIAINRESLIS
jgi:hypothetical protein